METKHKVEFDEDFMVKNPGYRTVIIEADVVNHETGEEQKKDLDELADRLASTFKIEDINKLPGISATRKGYKQCGKDPNRYRPSQEQLMRRIVRGLGLYNVNALVDAGNKLSLLTGCSVGCFDADKVLGDTVRLGIGKEGEPYEGIGRGELNISGLPVFRDADSGFGTPTSDCERTKVELDTVRLLTTVHLFDENVKEADVVEKFIEIFSRFADARNIVWSVYSC